MWSSLRLIKSLLLWLVALTTELLAAENLSSEAVAYGVLYRGEVRRVGLLGLLVSR